tara:strand:- start:34 stop:921 length:888 start_codon:yes stop_codon:yes gene_type:complete
MRKNMKLGVIGIGTWGKNLVRDFSKISDIKYCTSNGKSTNISWLKSNYPDIQYTKNTKKIFADDDIDAVVISTPLKSHYNLVKKALLAKKHVFIEKPLAQNVTQCNELLKISKKHNLLLFVGHVFLYHDIFSKIFDISKKEKITFMNFEWNKFGTFDEDIFLNLLSHDLSIILTLFGNPSKIKLNNSYGLLSKSDFIHTSFEFKNIKLNIQINRCANFSKKTVTIFSKKNIYVWDDDKLLKLNKKNNSYKPIYTSRKTPLENETKYFINQLTKKEIHYNSSKLAKDVIQLIQKLN